MKIRTGMKIINPASGSRLSGYNFNQIKQAFKNKVSLPTLNRSGDKPISKKPIDKNKRRNDDPRLEIIGDMSREEIRQLMENASKYAEIRDKNKSDQQKSMEKFEYEINQLKKQLTQKEQLLQKQTQILQQREKALSRKYIEDAIKSAAKDLGATNPDYILRDNALQNTFHFDAESNQILVKDDDGNDSGLNVKQKLEQYKEKNPILFNSYNPNDSAFGGKFNGKGLDPRKMTPTDKIDAGLQELMKRK